MNEMINYFIETVLCFGLFFTFYKLAIERENLLNFSRFYLLSTSLFSIIFPLIKISFPVKFISISSISSEFLVKLDQVTVNGNISGIPGNSAITVSQLLLMIYLSGIVITAVLFIIKLLNIIRFIRRNSTECTGKYRFLVNNTEFLSFSFFNYILIGDFHDLSAPDKLKILEHEKAHVDQKHSIDSMYFEILTILFWFNPFTWLYRKLIVDTHEYLADAAVIKRTGSDGYALLLVQQATGFSGKQLANYFKNSITIKRIKKMKTYGNKSNNLSIALFFPMVLTVFFIISCNNNSKKLKLTDEKTVSDSVSSVTSIQNQKTTETDTPFDSISNKVYNVVDVVPVPKGGITEYFKFLANNINYPESAKKNRIEGKVFVTFIVDKEGNVKNARVLKGFTPDCDKEAVRVISMTYQWKPGIQDGKPVAVNFILPVSFKFSN